MNYTHYNELLTLDLSNNKDVVNQELENRINNVLNEAKDSYWKKTSSAAKYLECLENLKELNQKLFRKIVMNNYLNKIKKNFDKKIRVVIFVNEFAVFPSGKSVYETIKKDSSFICDLVYLPFNHFNKTTTKNSDLEDYKNRGYNEIIESSEYDLAKHSPDIAIYLKPYDLIPKEFYIDEVEKIVKHIIYIPYGMSCVCDEEIYKYTYQLPMQDKAWINVSHCKRNKELAEKYSLQKGKNFLVIGNPRIDLINEDYTNDIIYKKILKKANGRKIFFYNPHHTISDKFKWGTFKLYGLKILEYFQKNNDLFLLYRPHPLMKKALEKEFENDNDFFEKYNELLKSENIFYDNTSNYLIAMHISNVLISDANTFIPEFTFYNKPVIYTMYPKNKKIDDVDLESMIYIAKNFNEIINYINELKNNNDLLKKIRSQKIKEYFCYDENKTVAQKLIEIIKKRFKDGGLR